MKHLILYTFTLLIAVACTTGKSFAQDYYPLLDSNTVWITYTFNGYSNVGNDEVLYLKGDTTINNVLYKKGHTPFFLEANDTIYNGNDTIYLFRDTIYFNNPGVIDTLYFVDTIGKYDFSYRAAIREDTITMQVFFILPNDSIEKLLYDFSINTGDTVKECYNIFNNSYSVKVQSIDSIIINGLCRKRYKLKTVKGDVFSEYWIEGIGSTKGLLYPCVNFVGYGPYFSLKYVVQTTDTIYNNANIVNCITDAITEQINSTNNKIIISPNPFSHTTYINVINSKEYYFEVVIYNILGKMVRKIIVNNQQTVINRDNLPSGIYFYKIYNTQGTIGQGKLIIK